MVRYEVLEDDLRRRQRASPAAIRVCGHKRAQEPPACVCPCVSVRMCAICDDHQLQTRCRCYGATKGNRCFEEGCELNKDEAAAALLIMKLLVMILLVLSRPTHQFYSLPPCVIACFTLFVQHKDRSRKVKAKLAAFTLITINLVL